jgi:threonine/homoserine/homoserine lactone efflux protein
VFVEIVVQLFVASAILLGSPGPVPLSLAGTGISFGFKAGLDYLKGIFWGYCA